MSNSNDISTVEELVAGAEREAVVEETKYGILLDEIGLREREKEDADEVAEVATLTLAFIEASVAARRSGVKERIEGVIGETLKGVYGPDYSLRVDYSTKNSRTAVDFQIVKQTKDGEVSRGIDGVGGGVSDTISLPLKLVVLRSTNDADKILLTDEPGKHINPERVGMFMDFIRMVSKKLGVQVIMCSHHEIAVDHADLVYRVRCVDGVSEVERLK